MAQYQSCDKVVGCFDVCKLSGELSSILVETLSCLYMHLRQFAAYWCVVDCCNMSEVFCKGLYVGVAEYGSQVLERRAYESDDSKHVCKIPCVM